MSTHAPASAPRPAEVLRTELTLLVLRFLEGDERLAPSFETLRAQAEEFGLLGRRTAWDGTERDSTTYERSIARLGAPPPPEQLQQLLRTHMATGRQAAMLEGWEPAPGFTFLRGSTPVVHRNELRPLAALADVCTRGREVGGHLEALLARERGVRLPRRLQPPRAAYAPRRPRAGSTAGGMRLLASLTGHRSSVYCCAFDRTGRRLVTGADDANVKIWSVTSGLLQHTCRGHSAEITEVAISPDNQYAVSTSNDGTARVWRLSDGVPEAVLSAHKAPVNSVVFAAHAVSVARPRSLLSFPACRSGAAPRFLGRSRWLIPEGSWCCAAGPLASAWCKKIALLPEHTRLSDTTCESTSAQAAHCMLTVGADASVMLWDTSRSGSRPKALCSVIRRPPAVPCSSSSQLGFLTDVFGSPPDTSSWEAPPRVLRAALGTGPMTVGTGVVIPPIAASHADAVAQYHTTAAASSAGAADSAAPAIVSASCCALSPRAATRAPLEDHSSAAQLPFECHLKCHSSAIQVPIVSHLTAS